MAAEFYKTSYSSSSAKKRGRSFIGYVVDSLLLIATIAVVVLFFLTLVVPKIDPHRAGELSTLGLVAPFVYAAVLMFFLAVIKSLMMIKSP